MLQRWLRDRCVPVVATLVTEDAEQTCRRNNLSFEQLVSAFARLDGLKIPFRSASQQYTLESLAVRFVRGSDMRPYSTKEADLMLAEVASEAAEKAAVAAAGAAAAATALQGGAGVEADDRDARKSQTAGALLESSVEDQEWYQRYRTRLWQSLCHQEHEMLDCPAAVVVVVSSTEASGDPVACFDELSSPIYLPPPFQSRQYDPQSPALVYLLLHDWCRGAALGVDPDRVLSQMRGSFTAGQCRLLCINSLPPESPNLSQPDLWADIVGQNTFTKDGGAMGGGGDGGAAADASTVRGALMSPEDILATKEFVRGLVSQVVVPSMERRIQSLNQNVSSVRKGMKNVLKSWWRKPREGVDTMMSMDGGGVAGGATYRYDRIESQIRLLADSAFLMRDYDTAASMYRMVRDDFKSDRAFLHYAAASEMLAISLYLLQGRASSGSGVSSPGSQINSLNSIMSAATVGGVATPTARAVAAAAASVGHDLATFNGLSAPKSSLGSVGGVGGGISLAVGGSQSAPNSGGVAGLNPAALLGRGREADTAFASALDAYQRRAAEDSVAAAAVGSAGKVGVYLGSGGGPGVEIGSVGGGRVGGGMSQAARLAARGAFLFADIAAAASEDRFASGMLVRGIGDPRGGIEILQAEAEEALLNASVQETPLTAALLLEVSAHRCRAAGRARRASFRLVQAGHTYKEFSTARLAALRQEGKEKHQSQQHEKNAQQSLGIHAARCFLGALAGYQESGWLAAEEYTCTVLPAELRALQRPVAAIQLYVRLLSARGQGLRAESGDVRSGGTGGGALNSWAQLAQQQQQQLLQKRIERERALVRALRDLCCGYPEAARIAASAWGRGRGPSKLDMTYFPAVPRASAAVETPPITPTPSFSTVATAEDMESSRPATGDLLGLDFDDQSGDDNAGPGVAGGQGGGVEMEKGDASKAGRDGDGGDILFEELSLPSVVHEQTRPVDTENASVQAVVETDHERGTGTVVRAIQSPDNGPWASDMADALRAELAAAEAVKAGRGPWLTVSAAYGYQAGALPRDPSTSSSAIRRPSHMPPPPRSAPVGEPVTLLVVLENRLSIPASVEDLQLDLTASSEASGVGGGGEETPVEIAAVDEKDFAAVCACPESLRGDDAAPNFVPSTPMVIVERKCATVGPGKTLPVLLKFCALRASNKVLTVSYVRWTVLGTSSSPSSSSSSSSSSPSDHPRGQAAAVHGGELGARQASSPRVWIRHRLEGKGQLLHGTLEQRAARARAPAPPPRFEAMGCMPWLGCSLEGVPPTILQGEAVHATLRIINKGRAAAGDLCLKTNLPWVAFGTSPREGEGVEDRKEGSGAPTGGAIGASGTTLLPPVGVIKPGETVELPVWLRGRGGGRQTVKMVIRYKRAQVSAKDLEGVSGVEGSGGESRKDGDGPMTTEEVLASPLFRMERHAPMSVEMCVLPSLSVAASVLPSYSRRGEYLLSLEATNYRTSGDESGGNRHLRIHKVCAISRCWHMEPLAGHPSASSGTDDGAGGLDAGGTIVRWQERITLHYRLFPAEGAEGEESTGDASGDGVLPVRHNDCALGLPGASIKEGSADSPHLPLLCLEQAASKHYVACRKHHQQKMVEAAAAATDEHPRTIQGVRQERERERAAAALRKEEEEEEKRWRTQRHAHPTSPDALCSPELSLVHLMVLWGLDEAKEAPARRGQHHVRSLVIRPERVDRQCPLVLTVNYPSEVRWDKHASSLVGEGGEQPAGCDAEVMVCATNRLAGPGDDAKVNFTFEVRADDGPRRISTVPGSQSPSSTGAGQTPSSKRTPRNRFVWLGPTRRRVVGLGPGEATTIPLKVRFFRPGVFDLNRFRFVVEFSPPASSAGSASSAQTSSSGKGPSQASLPSNSLQSSSSSSASSSAGATSASQPRSGTTSAQQQGRVTFVFPAQYLVTVAPASQLDSLPSRDAVDERAESIVVATGARPLASAATGSSVGPILEEVAVA